MNARGGLTSEETRSNNESMNGKALDASKLTLDSSSGRWKLIVTNNSGIELPHDGGPGTTWIYLLGSFLLLGCGMTLIVRRRIRGGIGQ